MISHTLSYPSRDRRSRLNRVSAMCCPNGAEPRLAVRRTVGRICVDSGTRPRAVLRPHNRRRTGKPVSGETAITFLIFKDQQLAALCRDPTTPDASGHYKVQLGATLASGLPTLRQRRALA